MIPLKPAPRISPRIVAIFWLIVGRACGRPLAMQVGSPPHMFSSTKTSLAPSRMVTSFVCRWLAKKATAKLDCVVAYGTCSGACDLKERHPLSTAVADKKLPVVSPGHAALVSFNRKARPVYSG